MFIPKPIEDFYNEILTSLLTPLSEWIKGLNYVKRLLMVIGCLIVGAAIFWHKETIDTIKHANVYYRASFYDDASVPLKIGDKVELGNLIKNTSNDLLTVEYPKKAIKPSFYNPWTESQIVFATRCPKQSYSTDYNNYVFSSTSFVPVCGCWSEFENPKGFGNHVATAWVMLALSNLQLKIDDKLINYLLSDQNMNGWWSMYPSTNNEDASTMGTAFIILALHKDLKYITDSHKKSRIDTAIFKGLKWLENNFENNSETIFDYPNSGDKKESISVNGMVLHTIATLESDPKIIVDFEAKWMNNFDANCAAIKIKNSDLYNINSSSQSDHTIEVSRTAVHDENNNYDLPWFIIATVDCYKDASFYDKAKTLSFFDDIIHQGHTLVAKTSDAPWLASEFLISLRQLNNEHIL